MTAVVAGYTFFLSKNSKKNRDKTEEWIERARTETLSKIKAVKKLSKEKYYEIVDQVSDKYSKAKDVGKDKADKFRKELKSRWQEAEKEAKEEEGA